MENNNIDKQGLFLFFKEVLKLQVKISQFILPNNLPVSDLHRTHSSLENKNSLLTRHEVCISCEHWAWVGGEVMM
jgi:hypothetical protein